ncbi:hypothetical protein FACS1894122_08560 [Alphaproteobacteria bacterium]|nr:hypothetical protein FACS1894122_08560 [Alphaproteobacteria bacterium]
MKTLHKFLFASMLSLFCNESSAMQRCKELDSWRAIHAYILNNRKALGERPYVFVDYNQTLAISDYSAVIENEWAFYDEKLSKTPEFDVSSREFFIRKMHALNRAKDIIRESNEANYEGTISVDAVNCLRVFKEKGGKCLGLTMSEPICHRTRSVEIRRSGAGICFLGHDKKGTEKYATGEEIGGQIYCPSGSPSPAMHGSVLGRTYEFGDGRMLSKNPPFKAYIEKLEEDEKPTSIIMIDDMKYNIDAIDLACTELNNIPFFGILTTEAKRRVGDLKKRENTYSISVMNICQAAFDFAERGFSNGGDIRLELRKLARSNNSDGAQARLIMSAYDVAMSVAAPAPAAPVAPIAVAPAPVAVTPTLAVPVATIPAPVTAVPTLVDDDAMSTPEASRVADVATPTATIETIANEAGVDVTTAANPRKRKRESDSATEGLGREKDDMENRDTKRKKLNEPDSTENTEKDPK